MLKSRGEIISNAIINGVGLPISIVMLILLIINSSNVIGLLFNIFISVGIILLSIFTTLYYSLDSYLFKIFSYISFITVVTLLLLYLCLSNLSVISWVIFGISIGLLIINIIFNCINVGWFKYITFIFNLLSLISYIFIGILFIKDIIYLILLSLLLVIFIFYYLYDNKMIIHYLLSISILLFEIVIFIFLFI